MEKAIIIRPRPAVGGKVVATPPEGVEVEIATTQSLLDEMELLFGDEGLLTIDELASKYPLVHAAIGNIIGGIEGLPKLALHAVAPPEGQSWEDINRAVEEGKPFRLKVWVVGAPQSLEKARRRTVLSYSIPVMVGEVTFEPSDRTAVVGDTKVREFDGIFDPTKAYVRYVEYVERPIKEEKKRGVLTEEEAERLREEFLEEEREKISLEELKEEEERAMREEEEREEEELVEQAISRIGESKKLLKHVLLAKVAALVRECTTLTLQKAEKKRARTT
jgi:hypothetical protein